MVVVSPFVGVRSQSDRSTNLSEFSSSLLENRFIQNQLIRQGTSLAGPALIAAGSAMQRAGDAPKTSFRSHLQARDTTGKKAFKPYTHRGRTYDRPLGKRGFYFRGGTEHGYNTNPRNKTGVRGKAPGKAKTGRTLQKIGRRAGYLGVGLVAYNVVRHGAKETAKDEVKFNYSISPLGMVDKHVFDGGISRNRYLN